MQTESTEIRRFDFGALTDFSLPEEKAPIEATEAGASDAPPQDSEPVAPPPPPTFSVEELEKAKAEAFEAGKQAGVAEEKERQNTEDRRRDMAIEESCKSVVMQAVQLQAQHAQSMHQQTTQFSRIITQCAARVAGEAARNQPEAPVVEMVQHCLGALHAQPDIRLFVHESIKDKVQHVLHAQLSQQGNELTITVEAKDRLNVGDAELHWDSGSASRNEDDIWKQIDTIISQQNFSPMIEESLSVAESTTTINEGEQA